MKENNKKNAIYCIATLLLSILIGCFLWQLRHIEPECTYERCIKKISASQYEEVMFSKMHRYNIDNNSAVMYKDSSNDNDTIYHNDYFNLYQIAGWEITTNSTAESSFAQALILKSTQATYQIDIYKIERDDLEYYSCDVINNTKIDSGFVSYFPLDNMEVGEYEIGILVKENGTDKIAWTGKYVEKKEQ